MLFNLPFLEWFWIFKPSYEFAYFTIIPSISVILCFHFFRRVCLRLLRLIKRAKSSIDRKIQERSSTKLYAMCEVCSRKKKYFCEIFSYHTLCYMEMNRLKKSMKMYTVLYQQFPVNCGCLENDILLRKNQLQIYLANMINALNLVLRNFCRGRPLNKVQVERPLCSSHCPMSFPVRTIHKNSV